MTLGGDLKGGGVQGGVGHLGVERPVDGLQVGEGGFGGDGLHLIGRAVQGGQTDQNGLAQGRLVHAGARRAHMEDQMVSLDLPGGLLQITAHGLGDVLQHLVHLGAARLGVAQGGLHLVAGDEGGKQVSAPGEEAAGAAVVPGGLGRPLGVGLHQRAGKDGGLAAVSKVYGRIGIAFGHAGIQALCGLRLGQAAQAHPSGGDPGQDRAAGSHPGAQPHIGQRQDDRRGGQKQGQRPARTLAAARSQPLARFMFFHSIYPPNRRCGRRPQQIRVYYMMQPEKKQLQNGNTPVKCGAATLHPPKSVV